MEQTFASTNYGGDAAGNYQKFFVPSIGEPVARDLIAAAGLETGERVLDVGCGTGVVSRLAARQVMPRGAVTGLDLNPGMIATARANTDSGLGIDWIAADAEDIPLDEAAFDVVLCQMSLQFIPNKLAALREMRRVLKPSGRIVLTVPGPKPAIFESMHAGIARHLSEEGAKFLDMVFSMHDQAELRDLFDVAGFGDIRVTSEPKALRLPPPEEFLWQYIHSTPLAEGAMKADLDARQALEDEVCPQWSDYVKGGLIRFKVGMTTVHAKP